MKKYFLAVVVMLLGMAGASAQTDIQIFTLNTADGGHIQFRFDNIPEMTFDGEEVVIEDAIGNTVRYPMADVVNITFSKMSGVESVDGSSLAVDLSRDTLRVSGLAEGAEVRVYALTGSLVAMVAADADGRASIQLDNLDKGVYIAAMPGHSFKFIR